MNTTVEIVDAEGKAWPPGPVPTPQQQVMEALSQATPWNVFAALPIVVQLAILVVLAAVAIFAVAAAVKVVTGRRSLWPRTSLLVGRASLIISGLGVVYILCWTAFGSYHALFFSVYHAACTTIMCLFVLAVGLVLWGLTRFVR